VFGPESRKHHARRQDGREVATQPPTHGGGRGALEYNIHFLLHSPSHPLSTWFLFGPLTINLLPSKKDAVKKEDAAAKEDAAKEDAAKKEAAKQKKSDMCNMVRTWKRSTASPEEKQALILYEQLGKHGLIKLQPALSIEE
jgi:hypothetical protein